MFRQFHQKVDVDTIARRALDGPSAGPSHEASSRQGGARTASTATRTAGGNNSRAPTSSSYVRDPTVLDPTPSSVTFDAFMSATLAQLDRGSDRAATAHSSHHGGPAPQTSDHRRGHQNENARDPRMGPHHSSRFPPIHQGSRGDARDHHGHHTVDYDVDGTATMSSFTAPSDLPPMLDRQDTQAPYDTIRSSADRLADAASRRGVQHIGGVDTHQHSTLSHGQHSSMNHPVQGQHHGSQHHGQGHQGQHLQGRDHQGQGRSQATEGEHHQDQAEQGNTGNNGDAASSDAERTPSLGQRTLGPTSPAPPPPALPSDIDRHSVIPGGALDDVSAPSSPRHDGGRLNLDHHDRIHDHHHSHDHHSSSGPHHDVNDHHENDSDRFVHGVGQAGPRAPPGVSAAPPPGASPWKDRIDHGNRFSVDELKARERRSHQSRSVSAGGQQRESGGGGGGDGRHYDPNRAQDDQFHSQQGHQQQQHGQHPQRVYDDESSHHHSGIDATVDRSTLSDGGGHHRQQHQQGFTTPRGSHGGRGVHHQPPSQRQSSHQDHDHYGDSRAPVTPRQGSHSQSQSQPSRSQGRPSGGVVTPRSGRPSYENGRRNSGGGGSPSISRSQGRGSHEEHHHRASSGSAGGGPSGPHYIHNAEPELTATDRRVVQNDGPVAALLRGARVRWKMAKGLGRTLSMQIKDAAAMMDEADPPIPIAALRQQRRTWSDQLLRHLRDRSVCPTFEFKTMYGRIRHPRNKSKQSQGRSAAPAAAASAATISAAGGGRGTPTPTTTRQRPAQEQPSQRLSSHSQGSDGHAESDGRLSHVRDHTADDGGHDDDDVAEAGLDNRRDLGVGLDAVPAVASGRPATPAGVSETLTEAEQREHRQMMLERQQEQEFQEKENERRRRRAERESENAANTKPNGGPNANDSGHRQTDAHDHESGSEGEGEVEKPKTKVKMLKRGAGLSRFYGDSAPPKAGDAPPPPTRRRGQSGRSASASSPRHSGGPSDANTAGGHDGEPRHSGGHGRTGDEEGGSGDVHEADFARPTMAAVARQIEKKPHKMLTKGSGTGGGMKRQSLSDGRDSSKPGSRAASQGRAGADLVSTPRGGNNGGVSSKNASRSASGNGRAPKPQGKQGSGSTQRGSNTASRPATRDGDRSGHELESETIWTKAAAAHAAPGPGTGGGGTGGSSTGPSSSGPASTGLQSGPRGSGPRREAQATSGGTGQPPSSQRRQSATGTPRPASAVLYDDDLEDPDHHHGDDGYDDMRRLDPAAHQSQYNPAQFDSTAANRNPTDTGDWRSNGRAGVAPGGSRTAARGRQQGPSSQQGTHQNDLLATLPPALRAFAVKPVATLEEAFSARYRVAEGAMLPQQPDADGHDDDNDFDEDDDEDDEVGWKSDSFHDENDDDENAELDNVVDSYLLSAEERAQREQRRLERSQERALKEIEKQKRRAERRESPSKKKAAHDRKSAKKSATAVSTARIVGVMPSEAAALQLTKAYAADSVAFAAVVDKLTSLL